MRYREDIDRTLPSRFPAVVSDQLFFCQREFGRGAAHLVFYLKGRIDEERLTTAVGRLLNVFPVLGCRFVEKWWRPYWERCDDLALATLVEVRSTCDLEADLTELANISDDLRIGPQIRIVVFRGENDTLCVRSNHLMVDGASAVQVINVLAEIYNHLSSQPDYQPPMNLTDRGTSDIGRSIGLRGKMQMLRNAREVVAKMRATGRWNTPAGGEGPDRGYFICHRLGPELVQALSLFARKERVSVNVLLQATLARAVGKVLGYSGNADLPIGVAVNLRGVTKTNPESLGNKFGGVILVVTDPANIELSSLLGQIKQQYKVVRKKLFGAVSPAFLFETFPVIRTIYRWIPFAWKRRLIRRAKFQQRMGPGGIAITNGQADVQRCRFEGVTISHIGSISGFRFRNSVVGFTVVRYGNVITLNCNYMENLVPREVMEQILGAMERDLQACAVIVEQRLRRR